MGINWESLLTTWAKPYSDAEKTKSENAINMVRTAISNNPKLANRNIEVFLQGSYRNNTNVKQDSDVDICVCCKETVIQCFTHAPGLKTLKALPPASYTYHEFKNDVESALIDKFSKSGVTRGDKAFAVHANTYRVDADVVPAIDYRLFCKNGNFILGTCILTDAGNLIQNYPYKHFDNGIIKNNATNYQFKYVTRIFKNLRNYMAEEKILDAEPIASYLIECLIYNVPNYIFAADTYKKIVDDCIVWLWDVTKQDSTCKNLFEVNGVKFLFHLSQKWSREQVHAFLIAVWGFIN